MLQLAAHTWVCLLRPILLCVDLWQAMQLLLTCIVYGFVVF